MREEQDRSPSNKPRIPCPSTNPFGPTPKPTPSSSGEKQEGGADEEIQGRGNPFGTDQQAITSGSSDSKLEQEGSVRPQLPSKPVPQIPKHTERERGGETGIADAKISYNANVSEATIVNDDTEGGGEVIAGEVTRITSDFGTGEEGKRRQKVEEVVSGQVSMTPLGVAWNHFHLFAQVGQKLIHWIIDKAHKDKTTKLIEQPKTE
jgi:hypothetical protein